MLTKKSKFEFIESRWKEYRESPRVGEIFAGRCNDVVYGMLFVMTEKGAAYLKDTSTIIGQPYDFFTHWLYVGEVTE